MDTGSSVSILAEQLHQRRFADYLLTRVKRVIYSRDDLPALGCLRVTIFHDGVTAPAMYY